MGATVFEIVVSHENPDKAFNEAVESALYLNGAGGYTGTIAEKGSFIMFTKEVVSRDEARELIDTAIDEDDDRIADKWGPAGCIEIEPVTGSNGSRSFVFFGWASC